MGARLTILVIPLLERGETWVAGGATSGSSRTSRQDGAAECHGACVLEETPPAEWSSK